MLKRKKNQIVLTRKLKMDVTKLSDSNRAKIERIYKLQRVDHMLKKVLIILCICFAFVLGFMASYIIDVWHTTLS